MYKVIKWISLSTLLILAACSVFKEIKNPPSALVEFTPSMSVKKVWSANVGDAGSYIFSPVYVGGSVYAAAANGKIFRFDNATGREIWKVDAEMRLTAGVGADDTTVAVAGDKGALLAFDSDGKLRWKIQAASEILSAPVIGDGLVIVRSIDNRIAAYEITSGKRRWVVERTLPPLILRSAIGLTVFDHNVYVGLPGGKLVAINIASGSVRWEATVGEPKGATELERVADVSGLPVVNGADICASAYQGKVSCFDLKTGLLRWGKSLSTEMGVSVDERFVFAVDEKGTVNAFSRAAGLSEWKNDKLAYRKLSAPISFGRSVAVGDFQGYIHFLSREDGTFLARVPTSGAAMVTAPILAGTNVIFQSKEGEIIALAID